MASAGELDQVLQKLCKWRTFFASWQLGTRPTRDGELKAVKDQRELLILMRVELNALTGVLLDKGVFTREEFDEKLLAEAKWLDHQYEETYPGWSSSADGMHMRMPSAAETMRRLGFPR